MSHTIKILRPSDNAEWHRITNRLSKVGLMDVYYRSEYINLYAETGRDIVEAYLYEEGDFFLFFPYIRRAWVHGNDTVFDLETAYGYGGAVASGTNPDHLKKAWEGFRSYADDAKIFAGFLRFHPLLKNEQYHQASFIETQFLRPTVTLTLQRSEEEIWQDYHSKVRGKIRKAERSPLQIEEKADIEGLKDFAKVYRSVMNKLQADDFYLFSDCYFERLADDMKGSYNLFLAYHESKCVGGLLTLESDRFAHLHLSAVSKDAQRHGTANLLRHRAICHYLNQKEMFHFGGGTSNLPDDSLLRFKAGFSKELAEFHIGKMLLNQDVYNDMCDDWKRENPDRVEEVKHIFLQYRS